MTNIEKISKTYELAERLQREASGLLIKVESDMDKVSVSINCDDYSFSYEAFLKDKEELNILWDKMENTIEKYRNNVVVELTFEFDGYGYGGDEISELLRRFEADMEEQIEKWFSGARKIEAKEVRK